MMSALRTSQTYLPRKGKQTSSVSTTTTSKSASLTTVMPNTNFTENNNGQLAETTSLSSLTTGSNQTDDYSRILLGSGIFSYTPDKKQKIKSNVNKISSSTAVNMGTSFPLSVKSNSDLKGQAAKSKKFQPEFTSTTTQRINETKTKLLRSGRRIQPTEELSELEKLVLRSTHPIDIKNATENITVMGETGIWLNKDETLNWKGEVPLNKYPINIDNSPHVITKKVNSKLEYIQELAIRYLRPPTPPTPGEIIIKQKPNILIPPAPPLIIRQAPPRPTTPEPLVIREQPPTPPPRIGRKIITIFGKRLPPPPRKVIIERLAPLPQKPQACLIERWLPYNTVKRRVILQRSKDPEPVIVQPKNYIVQWEAPEVTFKQEIKHLGVIRADPNEYVKRYGPTLKHASDIPEQILKIKHPDGIKLAADCVDKKKPIELEGDIDALNLVDLEKEGLSEYTSFMKTINSTYITAITKTNSTNNQRFTLTKSPNQFNTSAPFSQKTSSDMNKLFQNFSNRTISSSSASSSPTTVLTNTLLNKKSEQSTDNTTYSNLAANQPQSLSYSLNGTLIDHESLIIAINEIFQKRQKNNQISCQEAFDVLLRLDASIGKKLGESVVRGIVKSNDMDNDDYLNIEEFKTSFEEVLLDN